MSLFNINFRLNSVILKANRIIYFYRFLYIVLGYIAGFLGIGIGLFIQALLLSNTKSFGVSYLSPYVPVTNMTSDASYFIPPMWRREKRADFLNTKHSRSQGKISMNWKFWKGNN